MAWASRDGSTLDLLTVAETAPDPIPEDRASMNGVQQLSVEATRLNHHFSQQVLKPSCSAPYMQALHAAS